MPYPGATVYPGTSVYPGVGEEERTSDSNRLHVTEYPPMRQYLLATTPGGRVYRWGEDELQAANVIEDLTDSDSVPGGFKEITGSLPRKPGVDYSDMKVGTRIELFGAGGRLVNQCRLERTPRTSGDYLTMDPAAMGYQVRLTDDEGARAIPIDAEQAAWGEPSAQRKLDLIPPTGIYNPGAAEVSSGWQGTGETPPAILMRLKYEEGHPVAEVWYQGAGVPVCRVLFDFIAPAPGTLGTEIHSIAYISADEIAYSLPAASTDYHATPAEKQEIRTATGEVGLYALLRCYYEGGYAAEGIDTFGWRNLRVQDESELHLYGTWPEVGVLASDFIPYALSMWAPSIRYTTGPFGSIKASRYPIPHLVFKEPTTLQEMITQALKYELLEWGVWALDGEPTFFLNPRGEREGRKRWRARVRPAKLTETGQQMDQVWNRCVVSFSGTDGLQHTIGPAGSGATYIDPRCQDTDPLNPINETGEDRTKHLSLSTIATPEGAAEVAERFLEQCKLLDGSGEATLTGHVEDEHGIEWPYDAVHAGDLIDFVDSSIEGYRYIVEAERSRSSRSVSIKIDSPPDSFEALLERLGVRETAAGISS